jgi:hypothetical protein
MKVSLPIEQVFSSSTFTSTIYQIGFTGTQIISSEKGASQHHFNVKS